jgi:hypothetical protein
MDRPSPELRSPLAVVCHDAGACNVVLPWLAAPGLELRPVMQGPAARLFAQRFARVTPCDSIEAALDGAVMLLSGTGWASDLEHRARLLARQRGLFSAAVIDHWVNYEMRFARGGEVVWPDEFWVTDGQALAIAQRCFPGATVRCFDNLYLRAEAAAVGPLPPSGEAQLLYVLEPMRSDWGRGVPGEFQALDHFMGQVIAGAPHRCAGTGIRGIPARTPIRLRPHPSDAPGKYDAWIEAQRRRGADVALDRHATLAEALRASAWVVGCESFALVVAAAAGRRVWTSLPPWAPKCRLPHGRIAAGDGTAHRGLRV